MRRLIIFFTLIFLVFAVVALRPVWGQEKNLGVNKEVTAKIRAFDREFFKGFDVYSAGTDENPTALLFDIKDDYQIADRFWEDPSARRRSSTLSIAWMINTTIACYGYPF